MSLGPAARRDPPSLKSTKPSGPYFNGSTDEKDLPSNWSQTENIAWSVDLAGCSAATPIIWKDRVFLSGVDSAKETLPAMCFDRRGGKLLKTIDMDDPSGGEVVRASISASDGQLFIRTTRRLYCVGKKG